MCGSPLRTIATVILPLCASVSLEQALGQAGEYEKTRSQIRGTVVNSVTHGPLPHALVFSPDNRFATRTDAEGHFVFEFSNSNTSPAERPTMFMARKPGFLDDHERMSTLDAGTEDKDITITLVPEALITGRVLLPTSEAPDRIEVELYRRAVTDGRAHWVRAQSTSTKSNGAFRFADLAAGTYKLLTRELLDRDPLTFDPRGQLYGYPPVYFPNTNDFASAEAIQLTPGKSFQADLSISRQPYYRVKLPVINSSPVNGMEVIVSAQDHRGPGFSLSYNANDEAVEGMLPNGTYTVEASAFGRDRVTGRSNITIKNGPVIGPAINLSPGGSINVNVKEEFMSSEQFRIITGGNRSLHVSLEPANDFGLERGATLPPPSNPGDDTFVIENVQPGTYWVRVTSYRGFASSVTTGQVDLLHHPLVVSHGSANSPIEITLRDDFAELSGTVEGASSVSAKDGLATSGAASAYIYCIPFPDSSGEYMEFGISTDGSFHLGRISPGVYRLLAFDRRQPDFEYRNPEAMRPYDSKGQVVRLVGGQKEQVRLQLIPTSE